MLVPGLSGVRWDDGTVEVIWTYRDLPLDVPEGRQVEVLGGGDGEPRQIAGGGRVTLPAWGVYRVAPL